MSGVALSGVDGDIKIVGEDFEWFAVGAALEDLAFSPAKRLDAKSKRCLAQLRPIARAH